MNYSGQVRHVNGRNTLLVPERTHASPEGTSVTAIEPHCDPRYALADSRWPDAWQGRLDLPEWRALWGQLV